MDYNKKAIALHKKYKGKIEIKTKVPLKSEADLSTAYTPGVGQVCLEIKKNPKLSWEMTNRANMVAIVTDGTSILGLGDIGPEAGMPVMEGKSAIFKNFAGVDAVPLAINTTDTEEIIKFVKNIEPSFGGINLEDISAPRCFEITERLEKELNIPVFHDDQDGTAIVTLAAVINSCRVTGKVLKELRVVINGSGAAGIAIARLFITQGIKDIILLDSKGAIYNGRKGLNKYKKQLAAKTNKIKYQGDLKGALVGSDVFIGVSRAGLVNAGMIKKMGNEPIVLAMANPVPEIMPDLALNAGAAVMGTGRSDFPNQVNNAIVFPGIFRGLLDAGRCKVNQDIKTAVALAIAYSVKRPTKTNILPKITDKRVVKIITKAVKRHCK